MRGVLLVTVAVILIVLGLRDSDSGSTAAKAKGPEVLDQVAGGNTESGTSPVSEPPVDVIPEPDVDPVEQGGELPFVLEEQPQVADGGGGQTLAQGGTPQGVETVPAWDGSKPTPRVDDLGASNTPRSFVLGRLGGETGPIAKALLEAWITQDPAGLQEELAKTDSNEVSDEQGGMVVAFWQAMVGQPDEARALLPGLSARSMATPAQLEMLAAAMDFDTNPSVPEHAGRKDPLARSMRMVLLEAASVGYSDSGAHAQAARSLSELLMSEVLAPWEPHRDALVDWAARLNSAQSYHRLSPRGDWPALDYTVAPNESLELIRKRVVRQNPGLLMCTGLIGKVNAVGKYIHPGDVLRIPTSTSNMLVDLDARMAFYRHGSEVVMAWQVGIGREGKSTPVGTFTVGEKEKEPAWHRRGKEPLPYGHAENLLGARWLGWFQDGSKTDYGFHGTNDPTGVGGRVSSGCIRMRNGDVVDLFELLPVGSQVVVQP